MNTLTETRAKEKWCPMARVALPMNQTVNRISTNLIRISFDDDRKYFQEQIENCKCIASDCAVWRWENHNTGYCGLAGK